MECPPHTDDARILIVDDSKINVGLLCRILKNYETMIAYNGFDAIQLAPLFNPDLILLDIQMPGLDGFEVCSLLKESKKTADIPIIFLTGVADPDAVAQGFSAGAVDYIAKPFDFAEVEARIKTHISLKKTRQSLRMQNALLEQQLSEQQLSISLARALLTHINAPPPRYINLDNGTTLFLQTAVLPCNAEGGDHIFVRSLAPDELYRAGRAVISIKDQSGHAVNCILRSIITDLAHNGLLSRPPVPPVEKAVDLLNRSICAAELFQADDFCTAMTAELDYDTLKLRYVSAGHPPLILIRGRSVSLHPAAEGKRNLPLAVFAGATYEAGELQLEVGDKLLFFTDGVLSLPCSEGKSALALQELVEQLSSILQRDSSASISVIIKNLFASLAARWPVITPFTDNDSEDDISFIAMELEKRDFVHEQSLSPKAFESIDHLIEHALQHIMETLGGQALQIEDERLGMVLSEAVLNAFKHGNRQDLTKTIRIRWRFGNDLFLSIIDEGQGFGRADLPDPTRAGNVHRLSGRGLYIIRKFSSWLEWHDQGRQIDIALADSAYRHLPRLMIGRQLPFWGDIGGSYKK